MSNGFQTVARFGIGPVEFGRGGHADFLPARVDHGSSARRDGTWNAPVVLRIDGVPQAHTISVNPRRLFYFPLLIFIALVSAAPLATARKARVCVIGGICLLVSALGSLWVLVVWVFARVPGLVYTLEAWQSTALDMLYEGYVTPMANKLIVPLVLAASLVGWQGARQERAVVAAAPLAARNQKPRPPSAKRRANARHRACSAQR